MNDTHTPGPWSDNSPEHDAPYQDLKIRGPDGHTICVVGFDDAPVEDYNRRQQRNAELIKASPDLAFAVIALLEVLGKLRTMPESEMHQRIQRAGDALRKAGYRSRDNVES